MPKYDLGFGDFLIYLALMAGVTYLLRLLPMLLIRKPIENRFIKSVLYYIPYSVLTVMTVPAIFYATDNPISSVIATAVAVALAYFGRSLITVAAGSAISILITELIIFFIQ